MTTGTLKMPPHAPTPDDVEHVNFFIQWWQHILGGTIITLMGWLLTSKGKQNEEVAIPVSIRELEHRLTISEQKMLLSFGAQLSERDKTLYAHIQKRDDDLLERIKEIMPKKKGG